MPKHTITWTPLPHGGNASGTVARLSVHVAPRLVTDAETGTLADFPDWLDWPRNIANSRFQLEFPDIRDAGNRPMIMSLRLVSNPEPDRWAALFQPSMRINKHQQIGYDRRRLRSYPIRHVHEFVVDQWGKIGTQSPELFPSHIKVAEGFDQVGFEFSGRIGEGPFYDGPSRKKNIQAEIEKLMDPASPDPDRWAIPHRPADGTTADGRAMTFLQAERFHRRRPDAEGELPPIEGPRIDFHSAVAMTGGYHRLKRMLGLVLDFECDDPRMQTRLQGSVEAYRVRILTDYQPRLGTAQEVHVTPTMRCALGTDLSTGTPRRVFAALPIDVQAHDAKDGLLKLGEPDRFTLLQVDPDAAAASVREFGNNVTRAAAKPSSASPDTFALPSLRTAGLMVGRQSRAAQTAAELARARELNDAGFTADNSKNGEMNLYLDDVVRGYRWDVLDEVTGQWRSLMKRRGVYAFVRQNSIVDVEEETESVLGATDSGVPGDEDLYLHESVMNWAGWSMAVRRPGKEVTDDNGLTDPDASVDPDLQLDTRFEAMDVPRLRFGHRYRLRARIVDLAGNSLSVDGADAVKDGKLKTPVEAFGRFEPVATPDVLLRNMPGPAESGGVLAIRSNTIADQRVTPADRHILPPRTSVQMAEWHGRLDGTGNGQPMNAALYGELVRRDRARLEDLPEARRLSDEEGYWRFDTDMLTVPYLADPLAKRLLIRGLPGDVTSTTITLHDAATWPRSAGMRVLIRPGTPGWTWSESQRLLTITLQPADSYRLRLSAQFDPADLDQMALQPWIERWAAAWNSTHPGSPVDVAALRQAAIDGRHWMFTPPRDLVVVHAMRTPLAPSLGSLTATRPANPAGSTFVDLGPQILASPKSSARVDLLAEWSMPVDDGPGSSADPATPRLFTGQPGSVSLVREDGPMPANQPVPVAIRHEFGDTKHRVVAYKGVATSRYTQFFREFREVTLSAGSFTLNAPVSPADLSIVDKETHTRYEPARPGETDPATAGGDFIVTNPATGTVTRTANGAMTAPRTLLVTFVRPAVQAVSAPHTLSIPSTASPAAPKVRYIVPIFRWETTPDGTSVRHGGGLRVYLDRPWWSTGPGERLGVLLWPLPPGDPAPGIGDPPVHLQRYVTMWGLDPVVNSVEQRRPDLSWFPLATAQGHGLAIAEQPGIALDVAGHDVGYDAGRGLWYCDIQVGTEGLSEYFPFIRLALARYQPESIAGKHLSPVVTADIVQLVPDRVASVTGTGNRRQVQVTGAAYPGRLNRVRATVEKKLSGVGDPDLQWQPVAEPVPLTASVIDDKNVLWSAHVTLPAQAMPEPMRLVVEEFEVHETGNGDLGERLVYTDTIPLR